jgi:hypothetical protein
VLSGQPSRDPKSKEKNSPVVHGILLIGNGEVELVTVLVVREALHLVELCGGAFLMLLHVLYYVTQMPLFMQGV